jgi:hypothetical protein
MKPGTKLMVKGYDGNECGPFRWTEVREWIAIGYFTPEDEVRTVAEAEWIRIESIPTLLTMPASSVKSDSLGYVRLKAAEKAPVGPRAAAYLKVLGCPVHATRLNPYTANRWVGILQVLRPHLKSEVEDWAANQESHGRTPLASPDQASPKQIAYLRSLGHVVRDGISKQEVERLFSGPPTEGQLRRLKFYGIRLPVDASKDDAATAIDRYVREHPESEIPYQAWKQSLSAAQPPGARRPWWKRIFGG